MRDPNATAAESFGGTMYIGGGIATNHVCNMCHSNVEWSREAVSGPRIFMGKADLEIIENDQINTILFTAYVTDPDDNISSVVIDLASLGGNARHAW